MGYFYTPALGMVKHDTGADTEEEAYYKFYSIRFESLQGEKDRLVEQIKNLDKEISDLRESFKWLKDSHPELFL